MASALWSRFSEWPRIAAVALIAAALIGAACSGPQGEQGPAGSQGEPGREGPSGPKGDTGPAGPSGGRGPSGVTGPAGEAGPQGPAAPQPQARITTSLDTVTLDEDFEIWGSGFASGESVIISLAIDEFLEQVVGDTTASAAGSFRVPVSGIGGDARVRSRVSGGQIYTLIALGSAGTLASSPVNVILARPTPTPLPTPTPAPTPEPPAPDASTTTLVAEIAVTGELNTFWAAGFAPGETILLSILGGPEILVARDANESGAVMFEAKIDLGPGVYTAIATGEISGRATWPLIVVEEK